MTYKKKNGESIVKREPTPYDWDRVRLMYLQGYELRDIVKSYPEVQLSETGILDKMKKEGSDKIKRDIAYRTTNTMADEIVAEKKKTTEECVRAYKKGIDIINRLLADYRSEQQEGGNPKRCTAYNMDLLMAGINKIQKGFDIAFGEDKNGKLYEKEPDVFIIEGVNQEKL
jgi:hypothetical protein